LNDPEVFINPTEFNPDRWSSPTINNYSYLVFSGGPRACIGEQLAMLEIKLIIIKFVRKFTAVLNPDVPLRMKVFTLNTCVDDRLIIPNSK
jgi:cytochrome P450